MPVALNYAVRQKMGSKIRAYRKAAHMSRTELERTATISSGALQGYENGKVMPSLKTITNIAQVLHIKITDLTDNVDMLRDGVPIEMPEADKDALLFERTYEQKKLYSYFKSELDAYTEQDKKELKSTVEQLRWIVDEQLIIHRKLYGMICDMGMKNRYLTYIKRKS